ncbi:MAG: hypothetical protein JO119_01500, partial [Acidobacteria bacterium]|nr:hypothetical protein [Acidobacteriota bacterium]
KPMILRDLTASSTDNPVESAVISPDGTQLATFDSAHGFSLVQISSGDTRPLYKASHAWVVSWYPDGAHLLTTGDDSIGLWKVSTFDGKKKRLSADKDVFDGALSPDGEWIAFVTLSAPGEIRIMGSEGENPTVLRVAGTVGEVDWSPTSQRIVYVSSSVDEQGGEKDAIFSCDRQGGHELEILSDRNLRKVHGLNPVHWTTDGRVLFTLREPEPNARYSNIWAIAADPKTGQVVSERSRVTGYPGLNIADISESGDGKALIFRQMRPKDQILISTIKPTGELSETKPLRTEGWNASGPFWQSDGHKLAFYWEPRGEIGLYLAELETQEFQQIITDLDRRGTAAFTSDGKWLLFTRLHDRHSTGTALELFRMPSDGGTPTSVLTGDILFECAVRAAVCISSEISNRQRLFFQLDPIRGRGAQFGRTDLLDLPSSNWNLSPDGRYLAYVPKAVGNQVEILSTEGTGSRTITLAGEHLLQTPAWAADSQHLYVMSNQIADSNASLLYVEPNGKYKTAWTSPPRSWIVNQQPSPDGRHLALQRRTWDLNFAMLQNY